MFLSLKKKKSIDISLGEDLIKKFTAVNALMESGGRPKKSCFHRCLAQPRLRLQKLSLENVVQKLFFKILLLDRGEWREIEREETMM